MKFFIIHEVWWGGNLFLIKNKYQLGTSLVVQRVRLCAPNAGSLGSIPGRGTRSRMHMHAKTKSSHAATKIPCAATKARHSQNK